MALFEKLENQVKTISLLKLGLELSCFLKQVDLLIDLKKRMEIPSISI